MYTPRIFAIALSLLATTPAVSLTPVAAVVNDNRSSAGVLRNGVLTLHLEMRQAFWFPDEDGKTRLLVSAFAEEGRAPQIPGPLIRIPVGTEVAATIRNSLDHSVYVHGLSPRPSGNAKPAASTDPTTTTDAAGMLEIASGSVREVRFRSSIAGSFYYWASGNGQSLPMRTGPDSMLSGAFLVDSAGTPNDDRVFVINTWVPLGGNAFNTLPTINGKSWPHTERLTLHVGEPVHWRWINTSDSDHAMHLHGFYFEVNGVGDQDNFLAYDPSEQQTVVTQEVLPGGTFTMEWVRERPGHWLMHCHMTFHMMQPESLPGYFVSTAYSAHNAGMGGLVLGLDVLPSAKTEATQRSPRPPVHKFRLDVRERPASRLAFAGYSYVVSESGHEPPADTLPPIADPLVLTRGEPAEIEIFNRLNQPTTLHWHGIELESAYDGVPDWSGSSTETTPPIASGASFVARMTPPRAGTFIYHSHWHEQRQLGEGLTGPLIVLQPGAKFDPATDKIFLFSRDGVETTEPLLVNGSPQPAPISLTLGTTYRFRFINITPVDSDLTYSLKDASGAALEWSVIAKDGRDLPPSQVVIKDATGDSITVGETRDYSFTPQKTGELYLEAAAFQRMWVKVTLVVTRSALQPTATLCDEADGQITAYDRGDFCRQSRAQENKTQSSLLPDFYRICLIGNIQRRFYSRSGAAP